MSWSPIENDTKGTLTIKGGTFTSPGVEGVMIGNTGKLTMSGGSFTSYSGIVANAGTATLRDVNCKGGLYYLLYNIGKMVIYNGTYESTATVLVECTNGSLTIKDGIFTSKSDFLKAEGSTVKITGGTFSMTKKGTLLIANAASTITVTGGTFTAKKGYTYSVSDTYQYSNTGSGIGKVIISGGTFNTKATTA